ncbi:Pollen Ole e 1 allergen and extensin family protein [Striga hermonthica]|uniref:Pollen Ole e 1 allergen and extensin family protein n=1 Tax=Striga hermonthica TaxID=68872 RepID=A0A9N7RM26_STRHE|nr:Pollen Ole e 1 allergen and extensin family protein [Striga hermonthica]
MIILLASIIFFVQSPVFAATGKEGELLARLWTREQMVKLAGYGEDKLSTVTIGGKLLCKSGRDDNHPYPISGAKVSVLCSTSERTNKSWAKGSTDVHGEFLIDLPSNLHATPNLEKKCSVSVFRIPRSSPCWRALTGKLETIKLVSAAEGIRVYTTGDIHLVPKSLDEHMKGKKKTKRAAFAFW